MKHNMLTTMNEKTRNKPLVALKCIARGDTIDQAANAIPLSRSSVEKYLRMLFSLLHRHELEPGLNQRNSDCENSNNNTRTN